MKSDIDKSVMDEPKGGCRASSPKVGSVSRNFRIGGDTNGTQKALIENSHIAVKVLWEIHEGFLRYSRISVICSATSVA